MLILARREGETIATGDNITVTVLRVQGGAVSIGVDAPPRRYRAAYDFLGCWVSRSIDYRPFTCACASISR